MTEEDKERPVVPVHVCYDDGEAEVVIALLRDHGIEGIANSELSHSVFPITADGLGRVRVLVDEEEAENARLIIRSRLEKGEEAAE